MHRTRVPRVLADDTGLQWVDLPATRFQYGVPEIIAKMQTCYGHKCDGCWRTTPASSGRTSI